MNNKMVTKVMYNETLDRKKIMQEKPWFQFVLKLNESNIGLSKVSFPADPQGNPTGEKIHSFLLKLGLYKQNSIPGVSNEVVYVFDDGSHENKDPLVIKKGLLKIYDKLKPKGAELIISRGVSSGVGSGVGNSVSREEFEALKKQSAIADKELQDLEQRLQDLSN